MKDINVAMVSKWHVHAPDFAEKLLTYPGVHITAVWDEDLQRGQEWADELGAQFFPDYEALLDNAAAIFQFKGGSIGIVETGWVSPAETYLLDVCGTNGSVHVHGRFELYECFEGGYWEHVPESRFPEPLTYPLLHWVQCIQTDSAINRCTIDDAVTFTEMLAAAYRAESNTADV